MKTGLLLISVLRSVDTSYRDEETVQTKPRGLAGRARQGKWWAHMSKTPAWIRLAFLTALWVKKEHASWGGTPHWRVA